MRSQLLRWLRPPVFEDPEETRLSGVVYRLLVGAFVVILLASGSAFFTPAPPTALFSFGTSLLVLGLSIGLVRNGHRKLAGLAFLSVGWSIITFNLFVDGGLRNPATIAYPPLVLIAGVLAGARAGFAVAGLSALTALIALVLQDRGALPVLEEPIALARFWTGVALSVFLSAVVVQINERSSRAAEARRARLAAALQQAQRMEAVGRLAGGVAHDFNNYLTVVVSGAEALADELDEDSPLQTMLSEIEVASERSASLIRRLLAFSRSQPSSPQSVDPNRLVAEVAAMVRRILGSQVQLETRREEDVGQVHADPVLLETALLNLVVNARDAMPGGGTLTLETRRVDVGPEEAGRVPGLEPGRFVTLSVIDTGDGIPAELQPQVFEPFFTTKTGSGGTGLGLAAVYGTVQQSGGAIEVESEPSRGTTFRIYLPRLDAPAEKARGRALDEAPRGSETVLIVEDEELVRSRMKAVLDAHGYETLEAGGGLEALELLEQRDGDIDLLVTDVIMPGMGGVELARRLLRSDADLKVLFVSGFTGGAKSAPELQAAPMLAKPFRPSELLREVRRSLDPPKS